MSSFKAAYPMGEPAPGIHPKSKVITPTVFFMWVNRGAQVCTTELATKLYLDGRKQGLGLATFYTTTLEYDEVETFEKMRRDGKFVCFDRPT